MVNTHYKFDWHIITDINFLKTINNYETWSTDVLKHKDMLDSAMIYKANCKAFNITEEKRKLYQHEGEKYVLHFASHPIMAAGMIDSIKRDNGIQRDIQLNHNTSNSEGNMMSTQIRPSRISLRMYFEWNSMRDKDFLRLFLYSLFFNNNDNLNGMMFIKFPDVYDYKEPIFEEVFFDGFNIIKEDNYSMLIEINFLNPTGLKTYIEYYSFSKDYRSDVTGKSFNTKKFNVKEAFYGHNYQTEGDHTVSVIPHFSILKPKPVLFLDATNEKINRAFTSSKKYNSASGDDTYFYRSSGIITMPSNHIYEINTSTRQIDTINHFPSENIFKNDGLKFFIQKGTYEHAVLKSSIHEFVAIQSSIFNFDDVLHIETGIPFDVVPAMPFAACWKNYII